jgi:hypothetical protein
MAASALSSNLNSRMKTWDKGMVEALVVLANGEQRHLLEHGVDDGGDLLGVVFQEGFLSEHVWDLVAWSKNGSNWITGVLPSAGFLPVNLAIRWLCMASFTSLFG